ncbi:MAG: hypothetical protein LBK76_06585, partial [Verrucomicrobiales bacterium]|nr:hypothetical protein [Verrucomicrobiales bacterium]
MSDGSRLALDRVRIITDGASGVGANGGYLAAGDLTVEAPAGNGIIFWQTGTVTLERVDITALQRGVYITNTAALIASDLNIRTTGTTNGALFLLNSATAEVCRALIETAGDNAIAVWVQQYSTLNLVSGTLRTSGSNGNGIYAMSGCGVTLGDTAIETQGSDAHGLDILSGATIVTGSDVRIKVSGSATWGVRIVDGQVELENSSIIASGANAGGVTVTGTGALLLNNTDINAETGHAITTGSLATAELNLDGNTITGDLTAADGSVLTVIGSNGTVINGDLTGSGTAAINLTLSGSDSTLLGDIAQHDNTAAVTVILNDSATGQGGYNGGNLITGGDSTWTFNKDSHGNHGENHGVWNLGDYDVIFDNLTHSGTININVNSDTGEGGSITITGAADGDGIVHIDTTGNGKADPNQVLPGVVTGDGTDHWQWDPIDWGIDTIIKDGDHFIKQGTSPAGAVLNSSVAIQQAMWFA